MLPDRVGGRGSGEPARSFTDLLRSEIVSAVFSPNERLVEADLSDLNRVSRGTARAALTELAKEGLVERQPDRGARVRALSSEEATELTEARFAIEGLCAGQAAVMPPVMWSQSYVGCGPPWPRRPRLKT